jgi:hypothetical protein
MINKNDNIKINEIIQFTNFVCTFGEITEMEAFSSAKLLLVYDQL